MSKDKLTDEDKAYFRSMVKDVTPLKTKKKLPTAKEKPIARRIQQPHFEEKKLVLSSLSSHVTDWVMSETILQFHQPGIPKKRLIQLRRGEIPPEARLDLHGFKTEDAQKALTQFIHSQTQQARRCLLVIHGKGGLSGEQPVLKNLVNHWLKQIPTVLAFHSAISRDGGSGAIYVLLKRQFTE